MQGTAPPEVATVEAENFLAGSWDDDDGGGWYAKVVYICPRCQETHTSNAFGFKKSPFECVLVNCKYGAIVQVVPSPKIVFQN